MCFMLHFNSQLLNIVCSVHTLLINNDPFHLVSVYCKVMTMLHMYALLRIPMKYPLDFHNFVYYY